MSQAMGRAVLLVLVWLFSLRYYLECKLNLTEISETQTISAVFWILTVVLAFELISLVRKISAGRNIKSHINPESIKAFFRDKKFYLIVSLLAYILLIPYIGFFVTSFAAFCLFSYILGARGMVRIVLPGVGVLGIAFLVWVVMLNISLPRGLLF